MPAHSLFRRLLTFRHTAPAVTHQVTAGILTLASSCPALESCSVGYDIRVPPGLTIQRADHLGTIHLHGLTGYQRTRPLMASVTRTGASGDGIRAAGDVGWPPYLRLSP